MKDSADLKARYPIAMAWRDLGLPGAPGRNCCSPFPAEHRHGDANPSFSVFADGQRWKDFATGESGDVIDLIRKARGCDHASAFVFVRERLGTQPTYPMPAVARRPGPELPRRLPEFHRGSPTELRRLAEHRGFGEEGLRLAETRGLLRFTSLYGRDAWCVLDQRRALFEFRRLGGEFWDAFGRLPARKSHAIGTGKRWPIGTVESLPFPKVAFVEGAPDLLAAFHFAVVEGKTESVAPVAALGASNHQLDPEAVSHFRGKHVRLFPHLDPAGRTALRAWARQLKDAGAARIDAFDLADLTCVGNRPGKDLADVALIDPECFERDPKFRGLLP